MRARMRRRIESTICVSFVALAVVLTAPCSAEKSAEEPVWIVSPHAKEPDLPPIGYSLFDALVGGPLGGTLPFPLSELLSRLQSLLVDEDGRDPGLRRVLIPAGRSLQRDATGDHFRFPRAVIAVTGESRADGPAAGLLLRDRLFIAYHEPAGVLEVISYNEGAGRFEFQIVKGYRRDSVPKVFYAPRSICRSCHQNAAPIFSRGEWRETNAHRSVSAGIGPEGSALYGVPTHVSLAEPAGIDASTDRANELALAQFVWTAGCGSDNGGNGCRADILAAALRVLLTGMDPIEFPPNDRPSELEQILARNWAARWPRGVALPDADLPNRDPSLVPLSRGGFSNHVGRVFDPLEPRGPRHVWQVFNRPTLSKTVRILAAFFDEGDARRLDAMARAGVFGTMQSRAAEATGCERRIKERGDDRRLLVSCRGVRELPWVHEIELRLALADSRPSGGRAVIRYANARLTEFLLDVVEMSDDGERVALRPAPTADTLSPRMPNGDRIASIRLNQVLPVSGPEKFPPAPVEVYFELRRELMGLDARLRQLNDAGDALSGRPFRRGAILEGLGLETRAADVMGMNAPRLEPPPRAPREQLGNDADAQAMSAFYRRCGTCHLSREPRPPNFLNGGSVAVRAQLARCAPRIRYRLAMWRQPRGRRGKTPMPPELSLTARGRDVVGWLASDDHRAISDYLDSVAPGVPSERRPNGTDYETLPPCDGFHRDGRATADLLGASRGQSTPRSDKSTPSTASGNRHSTLAAADRRALS